MQQQYEYVRTEPVGEHFDSVFTPDLTPKQMLEMGIFGGVYMRDCTEEFPGDWFENAKFATGARDASLNFLKLTPANPLPNGAAKAGYMMKIRGAGFSGIVGTTWGDVSLKKTNGKLNAGKTCVVTQPRCRSTANQAIGRVVAGNAKHCFIGRTTAATCSIIVSVA